MVGVAVKPPDESFRRLDTTCHEPLPSAPLCVLYAALVLHRRRATDGRDMCTISPATSHIDYTHPWGLQSVAIYSLLWHSLRLFLLQFESNRRRADFPRNGTAGWFELGF